MLVRKRIIEENKTDFKTIRDRERQDARLLAVEEQDFLV